MSSSFIRWSGLAAMVGGALWVIGTLIHASKPRGCIAEECAFRNMRESGALDGILTLLSVLLLAVGAVGLVTLVRRHGRFGRAGKAGVLIGAAGATLLVIATLAQAIFFGGDFALMPYVVVPGLLARVVGFVLVGIAVLRRGVAALGSGVHHRGGAVDARGQRADRAGVADDPLRGGVGSGGVRAVVGGWGTDRTTSRAR